MDDWLTVITLERTPERFQQFCKWHPAQKIRRFWAVDGTKISRVQFIRDGLITKANEYLPGALGAAMSHVILWRSCAGGNEIFHIVEDDIVLRGDFWRAAKSLLGTLPDDWDIVLWSHNLDWPVVVGPVLGGENMIIQYGAKDTVTKLEAFKAMTTPGMLMPLLSAAGIGCYSLSPQGAAKFLSMCLPIADTQARFAVENHLGWNNTGIDVEMTRHYDKLRAFIAVPPLAVTPNEFTKSTIRGHLAPANNVGSGQQAR
jgi:GR25 family glycosyltransferase involved in LPS biosynthesis